MSEALALTRYEALCAVCHAYGSQEAMAEALSRATPDKRVYQVMVSRWLNQSKQLPAEYVLTAEADTGVSRHWLRPDIYPRNMPAAPTRFIGVDRRVPHNHFNRGDNLKAAAR